MKTRKAYGIIVFARHNSEDFVLLVKHVNGGHWSFPKGHKNESETEKQTAQREVLEETGIAVEINTGFEYKQKYNYRDIEKTVKYFASKHKMESLTKQEEEIADIMWCGIREASTIITYDDDKKMLEKAIDYVKNKENSAKEAIDWKGIRKEKQNNGSYDIKSKNKITAGASCFAGIRGMALERQ